MQLVEKSNVDNAHVVKKGNKVKNSYQIDEGSQDFLTLISDKCKFTSLVQKFDKISTMLSDGPPFNKCANNSKARLRSMRDMQ